MPELIVDIETWPIEGEFIISRGAKREARVVVVTVTDGSHQGRGECVPYLRYGETPEGVHQTIWKMTDAIAHGISRNALTNAMPAGAARNAIDCALWDLEAKQGNRSVKDLAGLKRWGPVTSAYTISLGSPDEMASRANWAAGLPLLKLKLGGDDDASRMRAVRAAAPTARLTVDANEAWVESQLDELLSLAAELKVELVEQPLPADGDSALAHTLRPVPVCADESLHTSRDVAALADRYDVINIKLDKAGGLTEALKVEEHARKNGLKVMVGCMVGTSLSMAPAVVVAQSADWVDLDGPLILARDRVPGLKFDGAKISPPTPDLWG